MTESFKPSKQRKEFYTEPAHLKLKRLGCHLDKALRKQYNKRALPLRKKDLVKIVRGNFKGKSGKVTEVDYNKGVVFIENIKRKKADGTEILIPFESSNLLLVGLELGDKRRLNKLRKEVKKGVKREKVEKSVAKEKGFERFKRKKSTPKKIKKERKSANMRKLRRRIDKIRKLSRTQKMIRSLKKEKKSRKNLPSNKFKVLKSIARKERLSRKLEKVDERKKRRLKRKKRIEQKRMKKENKEGGI